MTATRNVALAAAHAVIYMQRQFVIVRAT